jgi:hypothetical protein
MEPGVIERLLKLNCAIEICGSQVTCSPAPVDSDTDYLVEIKRWELDEFGIELGLVPPAGAHTNQVSALVEYLTEGAGYVLDGGGPYQALAANEFASLRKDKVNIILTSNPGFARRHRAATHTCRMLNVMVKWQRVTIFQAVLYGNQWNQIGEVNGR